MKKISICLFLCSVLLSNIYSQNKTKTPIGKNKNQITKIDSMYIITNASMKMIKNQYIELILSNMPMLKKITIKNENPLKFNFISTQPSTDFQDYSGSVDNIYISAKADVTKIGKIEFIMNAGDFNSNGATATILGEFNLVGKFSYNSLSFTFENGSINFYDNDQEGKFSEGTICNYNGVKYTYRANKWNKNQ